MWQQQRREQIPCGNTDNTEEKDPKGRPHERTWTAQRRTKARTRERRQELDGEQDGAARAVAGAEITRRKQTKKRDEIVTPGPSRGGYLGKGSRPIAGNPKYGEAGARPFRGISTGFGTGQLQHPPRAKTCRSPAGKDGCRAACAEHPSGVACARAPGGVARATRITRGARAGSTRRRGGHPAFRRPATTRTAAAEAARANANGVGVPPSRVDGGGRGSGGDGPHRVSLT